MNDITVRPATERDLTALCALYFEFHEFHVRGVPDRLKSLGDPATFDSKELVAQLHKIMGSLDAAVLVAEVADKVIGLAEVYARADEASPLRVVQRYTHLQSLIVSEAYRYAGIGRRLVDAAEQWSREQGAAELRLDIWEFAAGPLHFYEKVGYRTLRRTLVKQLGGETE